jgi:small ligand-binding sensory domain FIST
VLGVDHERAAIIVGDRPRVGQTIQFQMRDPLVADIDLHQHLLETRAQLGKRRPIAGLMASCAGRGSGLFGKPDHDAAALQAAFGPLALAGFRSVGEIGPIGNRIGLHSYAASIGLIVER